MTGESAGAGTGLAEHDAVVLTGFSTRTTVWGPSRSYEREQHRTVRRHPRLQRGAAPRAEPPPGAGVPARRGETYELLVVDDGSRDGTVGVAAEFAGRGGAGAAPRPNRGKGAAVRTGVLASRGAQGAAHPTPTSRRRSRRWRSSSASRRRHAGGDRQPGRWRTRDPPAPAVLPRADGEDLQPADPAARASAASATPSAASSSLRGEEAPDLPPS